MTASLSKSVVKHKVGHVVSHVVAHVVIPWVLRIVLVALAPAVGMLGLHIAPVAELLHVEVDHPSCSAAEAMKICHVDH